MGIRNKHVIRKPLEKGKFSTNHNTIMYDKRLTPPANLIFMSILNDSDDFNVSQELLMNRFGFGKKRVRNAFKNLEEFGYMKRRELSRGHYYILSEYGNLKNVESTQTVDDIDTTPVDYEQESINSFIEFSIYTEELNDFIKDESFEKLVNEKAIEFTDVNEIVDVKKLRLALSPILKENQKFIYDELIKIMDKKASCHSKKAEGLYVKWLKEQVYKLNCIPDKASNKWLHFQLENKPKPKLDHETMVQDAISEAIADGDY